MRTLSVSEALSIAVGVSTLLAVHSIVPVVLVGAARRSTTAFAVVSMGFVVVAVGLHLASPYGMIELGSASGVMSWVPAACVASSIFVVGAWAWFARPAFGILLIATPASAFLQVAGSYIV